MIVVAGTAFSGLLLFGVVAYLTFGKEMTPERVEMTGLTVVSIVGGWIAIGSIISVIVSN